MTSEVYEYDCAGNLIKDGRAAYSYDGFNRNIRTEMVSRDEQVNRYDAEGLRYELEENGRIASFVFAGRDVVTKTDA